jgi:Predicted dehydrogenases and related proteins
MDTINFGILGAGWIADWMARTIVHMPEVAPYAVASRDAAKAGAFAKQHGFAKSYGSYREMAEDPDLHLVYVATPNSHHYEHAKLCLENGKHVLLEKAFTATAPQAEELIALAREKKLLLTEAIWTRYMPFSQTISRLVADGAVGGVTALYANLGYNVRKNERIHSPALAGGALLDLSVYTLNFAFMILGTDHDSVDATCRKYPSGVDSHNSITLGYPDGKLAVLYATTLSATDRRGVIYGDKGYLVVDNINNPDTAQLFSPKWELQETFACPPKITGYEYQVQSAVAAIRDGRLECPEMPHAETIRIMRLFDSIRAEWGIVFDC